MRILMRLQSRAIMLVIGGEVRLLWACLEGASSVKEPSTVLAPKHLSLLVDHLPKLRIRADKLTEELLSPAAVAAWLRCYAQATAAASELASTVAEG